MNKLLITLCIVAIFTFAQASESKSIKELIGELTAKPELDDSNGIIDCISTAVGLFPQLGNMAKDIQNINDSTMQDMFNRI